MYKILDEVTKFIEKTISGNDCRRKKLRRGKIQRGIFQGDALSPLLLVIAMIPLSHILRKGTAGYKLSKSQEKINHLLYIDDIKLFAKNEKELETLIQIDNIYSQHIWMEFGIEKCAMLEMKSGKRQITEGIEFPNQEKDQNAWQRTFA